MSFVQRLGIQTTKQSVFMHSVSAQGICKVEMRLIFWKDKDGNRYELEIGAMTEEVKLNADESGFAEWITPDGHFLQLEYVSQRPPELYSYIAKFYEKRGSLYQVQYLHLKDKRVCKIKVKEE